jgi:hypothetical protein
MHFEDAYRVGYLTEEDGMDLIHVLVPTRGRPEAMTELSAAFKETCEEHTHLHWIIDQDDPEADNYREAFKSSLHLYRSLWVVPPGPPGIVHPLNYVVSRFLDPSELFGGVTPGVFGFMGDDHRPRTKGWDAKIWWAMNTADPVSHVEPGIVYGDDLLQGENLPTAAFLSYRIVAKLGFMAPPVLRHLYVDDFWRDLGKASGRLKYLPDVIIEHMHYTIGKSAQDDTYDRNNNAKSASQDRMAYQVYKSKGLKAAVKSLSGL